MSEKILSTYRDGWQVRQKWHDSLDFGDASAVLYDSFDRPRKKFPWIHLSPSPASRRFAWIWRSPYPKVRLGCQIVLLATLAALPMSVAHRRWPLVVLGLFNLVFYTRMYHRARKEARNGRNRRAEADHRDPQAGGTTDPGGAAVTTSASSGITVTDIYDSLVKQVLSGQVQMHTTSTTTSNFSATPARQNEPAIDTVQEDMPILAHRAARLVGGRGGMKLAALNRKDSNGAPVTFEADEDAKCGCATDAAHYALSMSFYSNYPVIRQACDPVPGLKGDCGWYAVPSDCDAWHDPTTVDLLVELSGRVIEHEKGYRAEHQRVIEVRVPGCGFCGERSTLAIFNLQGAVLAGFTCSDCKPIGGDVSLVPTEAIGKRLGVPVVYS